LIERRSSGRWDTADCDVGNEPLNPDIGELAMLLLTEGLLKAAGFKHNQTDDTWVAPVHPRPVVTVECDGTDIVEAMLEVHAVLDAAGYTYNNFSVNGRYVSIVGLTRAKLAAVA
jgi:hypothetical protein